MNRTQDIIQTIDRLFDENKPKEAEAFMLDELGLSKEEGRMDDELMLLNELIGYYRQTSEKEKLQDVISKSIELAKRMELEGTIPYATTMINAANACRSMGELEKAKEYYIIAEQIYDKNVVEGYLPANDMLIAGLYNNMSLLFQELSDFEGAESYLLKALMISTENEAGFEIAVTNANLANTYLMVKDFDKTETYAKKAILLFESRGLRDPHYCAALSALGNCYLEKGDFASAGKIFSDAARIVEETFGRNSQYDRLMESLNLCKGYYEEKEEAKNEISGMILSKMYYDEFGKKMISEKFSKYESRIAVGLVGEGSDCYGYDDAFSRDHDFGPEFCMWLSDEVYEEIGENLQAEYDKLPDSYMGFERNSTSMAGKRRGVFRISEFFEKYLGTKDLKNIDYRSVPEYALSVCTNGCVFRDDEGLFTSMRELLFKGYPEDVRLLKLAEDVAGFSQCGQYNFFRMKERGDDVTAGIMLHDFCRHALKLFHHILNVYAPHDKWLYKSAKVLSAQSNVGSDIFTLLSRVLGEEKNNIDIKVIRQEIDRLGDAFAGLLYESGVISDTDNYLDHHIAELIFKSRVAVLSDAELVDKIVRLEFEAFDKVKNEGGRASCQNNWPVFSVMRKSQYLTWNRNMLVQYCYDFSREYEKGHNLITEKYGRMMESTAPDRYNEIKDNFPELSDEKKSVIEQIVAIQMQMVEAFALEHPSVADTARNLHSYEDDEYDTSYETYLRGEISTYSDKMLQLYGQYVVSAATTGKNIAYLTIENTAMLYGYKDIVEYEEKMSAIKPIL